MGHIKKGIRRLLNWLCAAAVAVLLCNALLYFYHNPTAWIDRTGSATNGILHPTATFLMGTEGWGIHHVDSRGYLNPELPLAEEYTIVVGSSFVQGKEVNAGERFVDLMNNALAPSGQELAVYSVAQDGFYFPQIVKCFQALVEEFPGAETIIIETNLTGFSAEEYDDALDQHTLDVTQTGVNIMGGMSFLQRVSLNVKEAFPILNLGMLQLTAMFSGDDESTGETVTAEPAEDALARIRSQFDGRLIIFHHPDVAIQADGTMTVLTEETTEMFRQACERNGIEFLDISHRYLEAYETDHTVPCGFSNTTMGSGHLNEDGHRLCAEMLIEVLKGGEAE